MNTKVFEQWLKEQNGIIARYRQIEKSELLKEYSTLKELVESAEFQENKSAQRQTLLGKLRWLSAPEHQQEKRLQALANNADIVLYLAHTEEQITELESYKTVWAEEFNGTKLSGTWQTGFLYPSKELKANHSHVGELQAYTQGKNTSVNGRLCIATKKEKCTAAAWHPTKGMVMHKFAYTSDVWHTTEAVVPTAGVLQAKVRLTGKAKHLLCLTTPTAQKVISTMPKQEKEAIYTVVWNEKEVINYVNDQEVARSKNTLAGEKLHLLLRSYLPEGQKGTGKMEVDWIRVYSK